MVLQRDGGRWFIEYDKWGSTYMMDEIPELTKLNCIGCGRCVVDSLRLSLLAFIHVRGFGKSSFHE
jgi:hypothetical protein